jgi:hypothetical protein
LRVSGGLPGWPIAAISAKIGSANSMRNMISVIHPRHSGKPLDDDRFYEGTAL